MRLLAKARLLANKFLIPTGFQVVRANDYLPFKSPVNKKLLRADYQQRFTNDFLIRFANYCDLLLDVGANRGKFSDHFSKVNPNAPRILFEPIPFLYNDLLNKYQNTPLTNIFNIAVSDQNTLSEFHVAANDGQSSSLLKIGQRHLIAAPHADETDVIKVKVSKLDEICDSLDFTSAFLKIDVQGNEMPTLIGAKATLRKTAAVHIEVSIQSLYDGDTIGFKVWEYLDGLGFVLYGIDPWFRDPKSNGELLQADFYFVKKDLLSN